MWMIIDSTDDVGADYVDEAVKHSGDDFHKV